MNYCVSKFLLGAIVAALIADVGGFVAQPHIFGIRAANTALAMSDEQVRPRANVNVLPLVYGHCPCCPITHSVPFPLTTIRMMFSTGRLL
jgi:hypothetical protein